MQDEGKSGNVLKRTCVRARQCSWILLSWSKCWAMSASAVALGASRVEIAWHWRISGECGVGALCSRDISLAMSADSACLFTWRRLVYRRVLDASSCGLIVDAKRLPGAPHGQQLAVRTTDDQVVLSLGH